METEFSEEHLKEIARQLSCPEGAMGLKTGEVMNINNIGMTTSAIEALSIAKNDIILEIGHGNAAHLADILTSADNVTYFGADISETIISAAEEINARYIAENQASFHLTNGKNLPFGNESFDKIFTVNTLYFWGNPIQYLNEIKRVLKPTGLFVIAFADKKFMESLPFTKFGFELYEEKKAIALLDGAGFKIIKSIIKTEKVQSNAGNFVTRDYFTITASH
ncbi:class I SAM-dependent methyltransferase [Pedobacter aquatilis]|uniref:class I SAM-dependent methyltransferase n=1 Tax=Pedobacter aquatilis TaxID=351343 RepID=UPI00292DECA2|nr:class I SAM-dependent methyltransferase [Pedobacter aquatilis]